MPGCNKKHTKFLHAVLLPGTTGPRNPQVDSEDGQRGSGHPMSNGYAGIERTADEQCNLIGAGGVQTALPIVPVCVRNPDTQVETKTYALLDGGSTHSFCSSSLVQQLGLKGENVSLSLTTLEKSNSQMSTLAVCIEVSDLCGGDPVMVESAYVKDALPISLQNMATTEDAQQWHHLQDIEVPKVNADTIGLLIGQDTPEALMPLEIRHAVSSSNAPYATRTVLGWALNGPLRHRRGNRHVTNNFVHSDVRLEQQIERFWKLDTVPGTVDVETDLSVND